MNSVTVTKRHKIMNKLQSAYMGLNAVLGSAILANSAFADTRGGLTAVLDLVGKFIALFGVGVAIFGAVNWFMANSEGDGPAKTKAITMIASGIGLAAIGGAGFTAIANFL